MEKAIEKARSLIEAMEYIRKFNEKIVVVKLGGSVLDDPDMQKQMLTDVVFMATVGMHPVIVHGGGKAITQEMEKSGLEPVWVHGRRYTDKRTLAIVEHVLINQVNAGICETIKELGSEAMGLHSLGSCVLFAEPLVIKDKEGKKLDLGLVGDVKTINAEVIKTLCKAGTIPVIAPVACGKVGGKFNTNADNAAGKVAAAVQAEKLVMVSDTHGIYRDIEDESTRVSTASEEEIEKLIEQGIITSGMMPKVDACFTALNGGVQKAHIIDGRIPHSLLLEIYTAQGIGTQIV